jgi:hypothetical protein
MPAPPLAAGVYPPQEGGQWDQPGNFMKLELEFGIFRFFDASLPGHGGLFSKTRNCVRCIRRRRYPRRPEGLRGIGRIDSLGPFSGSAPAALLASFFSVRAGNVSFLKKRPPWPGVEVSKTSFHEVSYGVVLSRQPEKQAVSALECSACTMIWGPDRPMKPLLDHPPRMPNFWQSEQPDRRLYAADVIMHCRTMA